MRAPNIRIGIVGLGQLTTQVHIPNLRRLPGVEVTVLADPSAEARQCAALLIPGARVHISMEELLQSSAIDAVLIASPTAEHARHAQLAVDARMPFYLEKPLAADLPSGAAVAAAARAAGVPAMMGFNYRFHPRIERLPASAAGRARSRFTIAPRPLPLWKQQRSTGGGVLLDLASHHFDLLPVLLGSPVAKVSARIWTERTADDCAEVELGLESGASASCFFSFCRDEADVISVSGPDEKFEHDRYSPLSFPVFPPTAFASFQWERLRSPWKEVSFSRSMSAWVDSLRSGVEPPVTLNDGLASLRVVCAAERSSASGGATVSVARLEEPGEAA